MRFSIALLTILASGLATTQSQACCLTDWLFGRTAAPYAVGYAPYGYAAGYAPVATAPIAQARFAPPQYVPVAPAPVGLAPFAGRQYTATQYTAGFAPAQIAAPVTAYSPSTAFAPSTTSVLRPTLTTPPLATSGAYQVQRAGYFNNPNVYTGLPTANLSSSLRGRLPAAASIGAGNLYPTYQSNYGYQPNYAAAQVASPGLPLSVATPRLPTSVGAPVTALPTTQVQPLFAPTRVPPRVGGLGRFFGSLFGTNYRNSYYRAPVTYYRPMTSVDPVSGTTVTVQRPCTAYSQQLQRTPYSSLQVVQPSTCNTPYAAVPQSVVPPTFGPQGYAPQGYVGASGVGQVGTLAAPGQFTVPIPSTTPGYGGQGGYAPNTAPLTGAPQSFNEPSAFEAPRSASPLSQPPSSSDLAPVDQPRIENRPPATRTPPTSTIPESGTSSPRSQQAPESYWKQQDADDSMAMIRGQARRAPAQTMQDPVSLNTGSLRENSVNRGSFNTGRSLEPVQPIRTYEDYVSPFRRTSNEAPLAPTPRSPTLINPTLEPPPLPARSTYDSSDATSVSSRVTVPVRDAALVRSHRTLRRPKPVKRDNSWNSIP